MSKTDNYIIDPHNKDVEIKELKEKEYINTPSLLTTYKWPTTK